MHTFVDGLACHEREDLLDLERQFFNLTNDWWGEWMDELT